MAQLKSTNITGNLTVTGNALASKIIKSGGTTHELLLADGSIAKISSTAQTTAPTAVTSTNGRTYIVQKNGDQLVVNVPWIAGTSDALTEITVAAGGGLAGGGSIVTSGGSVTLSHADTSSQGSMTTGGRTYINSITLDTYGHVTAIGTGTETVTAYSLPNRLAEYSTTGYGDANDATIQGWHYITAGTNRPPFKQSGNQDYRIMSTAYSAAWVQQIATDFRGNDMFLRRRENGTWKPWTPIVRFQDCTADNKMQTITDNAIARWDSSGTAMLQNSGITISDDNQLDVSAGSIKLNKIYAPSSSGGTTYTTGTDNHVLKSNGTTVYWSYDTNAFTSAYCTTPGSTAAKTASCSGYVLNKFSHLHIIMTQSNTAASKLTLNVNGQGAKDIYIDGVISSSTNYTLPAGSYIVYYSGVSYYFRTDGSLTANITGAAKTLDGKSPETTLTATSDDDIPTSKAVADYINDLGYVPSNYLPLAGGTMTGAITLPENKMALKFRTHATSYETGLVYGTTGNEALTFAIQNPVTAFQIVYGTKPSAYASSTWQTVTPLFQTKDGKVIINRKITATADTSSLKLLDVNGDVGANGIFANDITCSKILVPTTSGGTTYGVGTDGQVLKSNGTTVYWGTSAETTYNNATTTTDGLMSADDKKNLTYYVKGTQTAATNAWTGNLTQVSALYEGLTIRYKLPYAGTSSGATLNLTLSGGATGAKKVYRLGTSTQITTHFGAGSIITMTYNGTNWIVDAFYDSNNYAYVRQEQHGQNAAGATNKYPLLARYNLVNKHGTYDTAYSRFHTEAYLDVSDGSLTAKGFKYNDATKGTNDYILLAGGDAKPITTSLSSGSTDDYIPTGKAVVDYTNNILYRLPTSFRFVTGTLSISSDDVHNKIQAAPILVCNVAITEADGIPDTAVCTFYRTSATTRYIYYGATNKFYWNTSGDQAYVNNLIYDITTKTFSWSPDA